MPSIKSLCSPLIFLQHVCLQLRNSDVGSCLSRFVLEEPPFPSPLSLPSLCFPPCHIRRTWLFEEFCVLHYSWQIHPRRKTNLICVWLYQVKEREFVLRNSVIWLEHMYWNDAQKSIDNCEFLYFGSEEETDCFFSSYTLLFCSLSGSLLSPWAERLIWTYVWGKLRFSCLHLVSWQLPSLSFPLYIWSK